MQVQVPVNKIWRPNPSMLRPWSSVRFNLHVAAVADTVTNVSLTGPRLPQTEKCTGPTMKGSTCSIKSTNKPEQHSCEYRRIQTQQAPQATLTSLKQSQRQNSFVWSAIFCPKSKRDTPTFRTMRLGFFICLRQPAEMRRLLHFLQRSAWKPKRVRQGKSLEKVGREPPPFWSHSDPTKNVAPQWR